MKNKFSSLILFILLFVSCISVAQQSQIDSLKDILKNTKYDTTKATISLSLAELITDDTIWKKYNAQALAIAEKNIPVSKSPELKLFLNIKASALNNIGYDKETRGDITNALYYYYESLKIEKQLGNNRDIATLLNNIADIYETQGNISKALEYYDNSLKLHEKEKNKIGIAQAYNNIGFIYSTQGEADKALDYYEKSYKLKKELNDQPGMAVSLSNIGYMYLQKKSDYKAMSYFLLALKTATQIGDKGEMALIYGNIGGIYKTKGNNDEALANYLKGLQLSKEVNDKDGIAHKMYNVGWIYLEKGKTDSALFYGTNTMQYAQEIGSPELISLAAELLKNTYKAKGNSSKALEFAEEYFKMHDSINSETTRKATYKQQLNYEYEKKDALAKLEQEKKDVENASALKRQQIIIWSVIIGMLIIISFSVSLYKRFVLTQKQKKVIEEQKHIVDEKNKEILDSITYAKRLQEAILPPLKMVKKQLPESFILYKPKDIVAGDFYWMEIINAETILFAAADCTGHGVPGAMVSVVCSNALNRTVKEFGIIEPGKILDKVRELVVETFEKSESEVKDGMDVSLCSINKIKNEFKWSGANNPLWIVRNNEVVEYKANKQAIGKTDNPKIFTTHTIQLEPNDSIYIFTDGYADQFGGPKGKKFKYAQLKEILLSIHNLPMEEQAKIIDQKMEDWKAWSDESEHLQKLEQVDDILIIGFKI